MLVYQSSWLMQIGEQVLVYHGKAPDSTKHYKKLNYMQIGEQMLVYQSSLVNANRRTNAGVPWQSY